MVRPTRNHCGGNRLLVEGEKDKRVLPYLLEANGIAWTKADEPVQIETIGKKTLTRDEARTELQIPGLKRLGFMIDADLDSRAKWQSVVDLFGEWFPDLQCDPAGFVSKPNNDGVVLGVWIMPDNQTSGMLETFLKFLVPTSDDPILAFAREACGEAKQRGAPFNNEVHRDKAQIHTWLAWQDEPGPQLHEAVKYKILDPKASMAQPFVAWFRRLFGV